MKIQEMVYDIINNDGEKCKKKKSSVRKIFYFISPQQEHFGIYSALHVRLESKSHEKLFVLVVCDSCHAADARTALVSPSQNKRIVCPTSPE